MSNSHTYLLKLSCDKCNEELFDVEVTLDPKAGEACLVIPVDVETLRLGYIMEIAKHEYDQHCIGDGS